MRKYRRPLQLIAGATLVLIVLAPLAHAQGKAPSAILNQYRAQRTTWFTAVWPFANTLFGLLATIEFAWSAAVMLLEKSDMQSWTSALVRKLMWIGAFYAVWRQLLLPINDNYFSPSTTTTLLTNLLWSAYAGCGRSRG